MEKKIVNKILKLHPDLIHVRRGYFFFNNFKDVLSGFCCEFSPHGAYINWLVFPLFERSERLHLGYGDRLDKDKFYVDFSRVPKECFPEEFCSRVSDIYEDVKEKGNIDFFFNYMKKSYENIWRIPSSRLVYAITLIKLGKIDSAKKELKIALNTPPESVNNDSSFYSECNLLLELVATNPEEAKKTINTWELEKIEALGIKSTS